MSIIIFILLLGVAFYVYRISRAVERLAQRAEREDSKGASP